MDTIPTAKRFSASDYGISVRQISKNALKVLTQLNKAGYDAYLVGGAVRDLLLGKQPKDFDIGTNATPEQVRRLFRNSRIIGRRFKIVHVNYGRDTIEVTTFRGHHKPEEDNCKNQSSVDAQGMLLRDNVFGSIEEDAIRRDFSINAFYYSPETNEIFDFTNGLADIDQRKLALIGNPATRYQEDPVRILRAVRFAAKLQFTLDEATENAIPEFRDLLNNIPPARRFDELLKLFANGYALDTYALVKEHGLLQYLVDTSAYDIEDPINNKLIQLCLKNTDKRLAQGKSVTPAFMYAVFLWPAVRYYMQNPEWQNYPALQQLQFAAQIAIQQQSVCTAIPKRFQSAMKEIWELQLRLPNRHGRRAYKLVEHPRFRAAYDFLLLREASGEIEAGLGQWWTEFQSANEVDKEESIHRLPPPKYPRRRRPRKRKTS